MPTTSTATPTKQTTDKTQPKSSNNTPSKSIQLTPSLSQTESTGGLSLNISSAVEMSLQLDSDANFINNVVMSAPAGEGEGLSQDAMVEPIMKEDLPIDLRAKLIIAMINLGLTPSEVRSYIETL